MNEFRPEALADYVTRSNGTEPPFTGRYWNSNEPGIYVDVNDGRPLFLSTDKFASACGWPAFSKPVDASVVYKEDRTHGMQRVEVRSAGADSHLGHVFDDGPRDRGGLRYCINSAALRFVPENQMEQEGYSAYLPLLRGQKNRE